MKAFRFVFESKVAARTLSDLSSLMLTLEVPETGECIGVALAKW
jgi:hypothetical protein